MKYPWEEYADWCREQNERAARIWHKREERDKAEAAAHEAARLERDAPKDRAYHAYASRAREARLAQEAAEAEKARERVAAAAAAKAVIIQAAAAQAAIALEHDRQVREKALEYRAAAQARWLEEQRRQREWDEKREQQYQRRRKAIQDGQRRAKERRAREAAERAAARLELQREDLDEYADEPMRGAMGVALHDLEEITERWENRYQLGLDESGWYEANYAMGHESPREAALVRMASARCGKLIGKLQYPYPFSRMRLTCT